MPIYLKQSTASQEVALGYFVDDANGNTEETGLTIANTDIKLHKAGATTLANKNSGGATHISNGVYYAVLDATDTNTLGSLVIFCHPSGALPVRVECVVLAANIYDSLIGGGDVLDVSVTQISGSAVSTSSAQLGVNVVQAAGTAWGSGAITAASIASDAITAAKIANGAIDAATFAADVDAEILSYLVDDATRIDASALNTASGTSIPAILADTGTDGVVVAAASKTGYTLAATTGLGNQTADITGNLSGSVGSVTGAVGSVTGNVGGNVTGSVGSVAAGGITAASIAADAIDADALAADATSEIGTAVWATAARTLTANTNLNDPTAAAIADAVWDEALSGHTVEGSAGAGLTAAGSAGDPWATAVPGAYGAGTAGNILGNRLVGTIASGTHNPQSGDAYARLGAPAGASVSADVADVKSDTAAVLADTGTDGVVVAAASKTGYTLAATTGLGNQTADITGNLSGSVGSVTAGVTLADDAITAAKFDQSSAHPLAQADSGATAVARTGADADTLETLSDQLDGAALETTAQAILTDTAEIGAAGAGLTEAGGTGDHLTALPEVDANIVKVNDVTVTGNGASPLWGPA